MDRCGLDGGRVFFFFFLMEGQQEHGWEEHLTCPPPRRPTAARVRHAELAAAAEIQGKTEASPLTKNIQNRMPEHAKSRTSIAALPSLSSLFTTHLTPLPPSKTTTFSIILF